jgi:Zn-dependent protease
MLPTRQGAIHLVRIAGIDLYLHWSWFAVAVFQLHYRAHHFTSLKWNVLEYLALFAIVLMHEFGHSLACRQVGGRADQIILWPLGGVAYVSPPPRPGAVLWSIVAGPLVNVALIPVFMLLQSFAASRGWHYLYPNAWRCLDDIALINIVILVFNVLPIYPLDGGKILRSLLWYAVGPVRSLLIAASIGMLGVVALGGLAFYWQSIWIGILAVFMGQNCWRALQEAREAGSFTRAL